jgi:hypothetical protein
LAGVRLITGTSVLLWPNVYDLRDYFSHSSTSGSSGGGGAPTDAEYVVMSADATLSDERVLTAGADIDIVDGGAGGNATVSVSTGTFARVPHGHSASQISDVYAHDVAIYEDHVFQATGTILDFTGNIDVAVTGTVVFVNSTGGGGGGSDILIYDDGVFKVTGTSLDFEDGLTVDITGSTAYINSTSSVPIGIGARVYNSTGTIVSNNTQTALTFDTERYDTDGMHSGTSSQLFCNTAGKYLISFNASFEPHDTSWRLFGIYLNNTTIIGYVSYPVVSVNQVCIGNITTIYDLAVGDYVEAIVHQNSGGDLDIIAGANYSPEFMMQLVEVGQDNSIQISKDSVWKATGTHIDFGENVNVAVTGSVVFVSTIDTQGGGGGGGDLLIYDDSVFKVQI